MTDAAAKNAFSLSKSLPPPPPFPKYCGFFSGDSPPPAPTLPCLTPAPFALLVAVPPGVLSQQQKKLRARSAGSQNRHIWGTLSPWYHKYGGPKKASSQGPGELAPQVLGAEEPAFGRAWAKPPQSSPGTRFCQEKGPETGMQRAV